MPDTLIKFKTGDLSKMDNGATDEVSINNGTVYFATDDTTKNGKIYFDSPEGDRIDMTAYAKESDYATLAGNIDGVVSVANGGTGATDAATARTNLAITPVNIGAAISTHTHGNITNDGKVGTAANKAVYTTTGGTVTAGILPVAAGGTGASSLANITAGKATADASGNTITTTYAKKSELPTDYVQYISQTLTDAQKEQARNNIGIKNLVDGSAEGSLRATGTMEESSTYSMGQRAVALGAGTKASGRYSYAEGGGTTASGESAHAEGSGTTASGNFSHAEGGGTTASGNSAHAEGRSSFAQGAYSHTEGNGTTARYRAQHVFGEHNILDPYLTDYDNRGIYVEIVGNGTADNERSNARTLDWSGNEVLSGKLTVGTDPTNNMDVATKQYVDNAFVVNDAMIFKGVLDSPSEVPATHQAGWTYRIGTTGTYAGKICEVGDLLICTVDGTTASNDHWNVVQNNIDGALFKGTNTFTDGQVLIADGVTGKTKTSGFTIAKSVPSDALFTDTIYIHPSTTATAAAAVKVGNDNLGHVILGDALTANDLNSVAYIEQNLTLEQKNQARTNIGAVGVEDIPTKVSDLTNDTGFITSATMTILSYGSSTWQDFLTAYNANNIVYCRASSNANPASGSQTRLAFMAYVNNATSPTEVEFQYYRSMSSHSASQQGDQVFVYKLTKTNSWTVITREASVKIVVGTGLSSSYSNNILTLTTDIPVATTSASGLMSSTDKSNLDTLVNGNISITKSQISDFPTSMPASDVSSWAKAASKPTYTAAEVGAATDDHTHTIKLASDTGTSTVSLTSGGKFKLTAGGSSVIFTMPSLSSSDVTTALGFTPYNATNPNGYTNNTGTITGVTGSDGLTGSGTSGSVTIKHAAPSTSPATTTSAIYPITIDKYGHITAKGSAVTPLTASSTLDASKLSGTIPASCYTNTTYGAEKGISLSSGKFGHSNTAITAQTTQAVYPIKIDAYGHITGYGSAVTSMPASDVPAWAKAASKPTYTASEVGALPIPSGGSSGQFLGLNSDGAAVWVANPNTDTKNTAGSTNSDSKLFLIGATSQAANPQTYSDAEVYTTNGTLSTKILSASAGVNANTAGSGSAGGVSLFSTNPESYGLLMRNTGKSSGQLGKHGYVQGDWAGYLTFTGATNRGYIFRHAGGNVASVSGEGHAVFNGTVTVGGNATNTSGVRMEYNSTTESLDFIFN